MRLALPTFRCPRPPHARLWRAALAALVLMLAACSTQPDPITTRMQHAEADLIAYRARAPKIDHPINLDDAIRLALENNLDVWVARQERAFKQELVTQANLRLLPRLAADGEHSDRSEYDASRSVSILSGNESLEPSYSEERHKLKFDLDLTWDLLDFGVSFLRSRQAQNRADIAAQRLRRVRQRLVFDVTRAYWQAVTAREVAAQTDAIQKRITRTLESTNKEIEEQTISEVDGLKRVATLLEQKAVLDRYRQRYQASRAELARLMGVSVEADFELAAVDLDQPVEPLAIDMQAMQKEALLSRPELYEKDFEQYISDDDARVAIAKMLPSPSAFFRFETDQNKYLFANDWYSVGLRVSWDLLSIPQRLAERESAELHADLIARQRTALAVAIITQLHLSAIELDDARRYRATTRTISEKRARLVKAMEAMEAEGKSHEGEIIEQQMKFLTARAKYLSAHADLMNARERITTTIGRDPTVARRPALAPVAEAQAGGE